MKAALYIRVSTKRQGNEGASLENQEKRLREYAAYKNYEVVKVYQDEASGTSFKNRPGYQQMMDEIDQYDIIIANALSRFGRNAKELLIQIDDLLAKKKQLYFADFDIAIDTAIGRAILIFMSAIVEMESKQISERTISVNETLKKAGRVYCANVPFGFNKQGKEFVVNEFEKPIVKLIYDLYNDGWSMNEIARELNRLGHRPKTGKVFWLETVRRIINNDYYEQRFGYKITTGKGGSLKNRKLDIAVSNAGGHREIDKVEL